MAVYKHLITCSLVNSAFFVGGGGGSPRFSNLFKWGCSTFRDFILLFPLTIKVVNDTLLIKETHYLRRINLKTFLVTNFNNSLSSMQIQKYPVQDRIQPFLFKEKMLRSIFTVTLMQIL